MSDGERLALVALAVLVVALVLSVIQDAWAKRRCRTRGHRWHVFDDGFICLRCSAQRSARGRL